MKTLWCVLAVGLAGLGVPAGAQLPSSVLEPYRQYTLALDQGDVEAAADAALQAWHAGRASGLDNDTLKALGTNAFAANRDAERWPEVAALGAAVAMLHAEPDEYETAILILEQGLLAALASMDRLHYAELMQAGFSLTAAREENILNGLNRLLRVRSPYGSQALAALNSSLATARIEELVQMGADQAMECTNLQAALADVQTEGGEPAQALHRIETAIAQLSDWQVSDPRVLDVLLQPVAKLLAELEPDGSGPGIEHLSPRLTSSWCGYLGRHPVSAEPDDASQPPMRALARGYEGALVRMRLRIPAEGGPARILEESVLGPGGNLFLASVRSDLETRRFRAQCDADGADLIVERWEAFSEVDREGFREAVALLTNGWTRYVLLDHAD